MKTISAGHSNDNIAWTYQDFDTNSLTNGKIIKYRKNDLLKMDSYDEEFGGGDVISMPDASFDENDKRIDNKNEFGVGFYGKAMKGVMNRMKKTQYL